MADMPKSTPRSSHPRFWGELQDPEVPIARMTDPYFHCSLDLPQAERSSYEMNRYLATSWCENGITPTGSYQTRIVREKSTPVCPETTLSFTRAIGLTRADIVTPRMPGQKILFGKKILFGIGEAILSPGPFSVGHSDCGFDFGNVARHARSARSLAHIAAHCSFAYARFMCLADRSGALGCCCPSTRGQALNGSARD